MELSNSHLSDHLRPRHARPLRHLGMELRQIPHHAATHLPQPLQLRCAGRLLRARLRLHHRRLLPPAILPIVLGASPLLSGVYLFPFIITLSFASIATGIYTRSMGEVILAIWFGMLFLILGHGLYIDLQPYISWVRIILFEVLVGLGVAPNFQAPLIALSSGVEPRDMAAATATFGFARHLANAVSVVIGVIFQNQINAKRATLEAALPADLVARLSGGDAGSASNLVTSLPAEQQAIVRAVYTKSLQTLWIFYMRFVVLGLLAVLFIRSHVLSTTHEAAKTGWPQEENARGGGERKERAGDLESD